MIGVAGYVPAPDATVSKTMIYDIIGNAEIKDLGPNDFAGLNCWGYPVASNSAVTAVPDTFQFHPSGIRINMHSAVSLEGVTYEWGMSKNYIAVSRLPSQELPKGWPVYSPFMESDDEHGPDYVGHTAYSVGESFQFPVIDGRVNNWSLAGGFVATQLQAHYMPYKWVILQNVCASSTSFTFHEICMYGFADALFHATYSEDLTPQGVYGMKYVEDNEWLLPVALACTNQSQVTAVEFALGQIRAVYTDSGITSITLPGAGVEAPFYVGKVFFGGDICL